MNKIKKLNRRHFLQSTAAGAGLVLASPSILRAQNRRIVVTSGGGAYGQGQVDAYFKPFTEATGIEVHATLSGLSLAEKKAQVETGNVTADLVSMGFPDVNLMGANGWLEEIDYSQFDQDDIAAIGAHDRTKYGMGFISWAEVIAYRTDVFGKGTGPKNWADFWNTEAFPGPRALGDSSYMYSFETALMADGVGLNDVYPCDIDRALASFSNIRDDVVAWWGKSAAQPVQLINDNEVVMCSVANGRIREVIEAGAPVELSWDQGIVYRTAYAMLKGAKNVEDTTKLLAFIARPEQQARMAEILGYGPANQRAFELISPEDAVNLPTNPAYADKVLLKDWDWWTGRHASGRTNREFILERWEEWKLLG